jgi:hypothetical protein
MAKRFTDSNKWSDDWFSELDQNAKLAWLYILDNCDQSGIWKKNIRLMNFSTGCSFVEDDLLKLFNKRIFQLVEDKNKWFIPKFLVFQYGPDYLNSNNKVVIKVLKTLFELKLVYQFNNKYTLSIPYQSSIDTLKDKEEDKEEVKEQDKEKV